ncbi:MAG: hypothetical protein ACLRSW_02480 [Christensenellaceae bacterium]
MLRKNRFPPLPCREAGGKDELEVKAHPAEADKAARYLKENDCGKGVWKRYGGGDRRRAL